MLRVCGNHADAEDVLIEALLKAYRHLDQLQDSAAFRAWLAKIASRICWQLRKREALLPLPSSSRRSRGKEKKSQPTSRRSTEMAGAQMKNLLFAAVANPRTFRSGCTKCETYRMCRARMSAKLRYIVGSDEVACAGLVTWSGSNWTALFPKQRNIGREFQCKWEEGTDLVRPNSFHQRRSSWKS